MRIYGLKSCDTCRKALKALEAAGHAPAFHDIRAAPLPPGEITRFRDTFGDALVNRRSTTWRGLDEADRAADPAALLAAHPALMKRPVIEADGVLYLGWGPEVQVALLG
ncbi:arsenate reductase [Rhodovulum iodosum]|uniref:Arsenate reductase n=1 Tax=Rhodovulum iodosum TaxID=68291 RepID=A0ABV3XPT7_9RHOB|nr:ArsC/Spx/MgsR family protein [Rhodovulum robiginosum]RSK31483.1 arsenate reductase [Rhodovulum robiginosum]